MGSGKGLGPGAPPLLCFNLSEKKKQPTGQGIATKLERVSMCTHTGIMRYTRAKWVQVKG